MNDRIKQIMEENQLTASAFADKLGVQRSAISHILSGRNKPGIEMLIKMIEQFPDMDIQWLLTGKNAHHSPAPSNQNLSIQSDQKEMKSRKVEKVIVFYSDNTFEAFNEAGSVIKNEHQNG